MKKTNHYWNANLGETALRKIQLALAEDKAAQLAIPHFTDMAERARARNVAKVDRIIKDIDALLNP